MVANILRTTGDHNERCIYGLYCAHGTSVRCTAWKTKWLSVTCLIAAIIYLDNRISQECGPLTLTPDSMHNTAYNAIDRLTKRLQEPLKLNARSPHKHRWSCVKSRSSDVLATTTSELRTLHAQNWNTKHGWHSRWHWNRPLYCKLRSTVNRVV